MTLAISAGSRPSRFSNWYSKPPLVDRPMMGGRLKGKMLAPRIIEFFRTPPELKESQDQVELRAWLLAHGAPADFQIPARLAALKSVGCTVVDVKGKPAWHTCFRLDPRPGATDRELIHLFAVRRSDFRDAPAGPFPVVREMEGWSFASWAAGDLIYTMATPAPVEKLRPFLVGEPRRLPCGVVRV